MVRRCVACLETNQEKEIHYVWTKKEKRNSIVVFCTNKDNKKKKRKNEKVVVVPTSQFTLSSDIVPEVFIKTML